MGDHRTPTGIAAKPWQAITLPPRLTAMRSMLSHEEKQYLTWLTASQFEGWGAIVDLGAWLGSSTAALAEGLDRAGRGDRVHSFDRWRWEPNYMEVAAPENLEPGDDFLPHFLRELGGYASRAEPHKVDLMEYAWNGEPIEILFVDAAKTWELTNAIFKGFGDRVVPGRTRVVLQDFRYYETHWLPLIFDSRPDLWREVEAVDDGTTVTFIPLRPLHGPAGLDPHYSETTFSLDEAERLLRARIARDTGPNRHRVLQTLYRIVVAEGSAEAASQVRREVVATGVPPGELRTIEGASGILVPRGWRAFDRGDFQASREIAERCLADPTDRPVYAVALMGMSLLRLGDTEGARLCVDEVLSRMPGFLDGRLHRAEVAVAQLRYADAAADAQFVLSQPVLTDPMIVYARALLEIASGRSGEQVPSSGTKAR